MKAKVIETGEIVDITPYPTWYKENGQGPDRREWDENEIEFIRSEKKDEAVENFVKSKKKELEKMIPGFVDDTEFVNVVLNFYEKGLREGIKYKRKL